MQRRAEHLKSVIKGWSAAGGGVQLLTVTLGHGLADSLAASWAAVADGWRWVNQGGAAKKLREKHGIVGMARSMDVTWTPRSGWHPHLHVLVLTTDPYGKADAAQLEHDLWLRWQKWAQRQTRSASKVRAVKVQPVDLGPDNCGTSAANYVAGHLAYEVASPGTKSSSVGPWELLDRACDGDAQASKLWEEWEVASYGRRQMTYTQDFRLIAEAVGVQDLLISDEDLAAIGPSDGYVEVLLVPSKEWARVLASGLAVEWLETIESVPEYPGWHIEAAALCYALAANTT